MNFLLRCSLQPQFCKRRASSSVREELRKVRTEERSSRVLALNTRTSQRTVFELIGDQETSTPKTTNIRRLPTAAITGLREALLATDTSYKMLQNQADQLAEKLEQRRFPAPAEVVLEAKKMLRSALQTKNMPLTSEDLATEEVITATSSRQTVQKILKKSFYNWRALDIRTQSEAAAYALSRLAPNYAEVSRVVAEFSRLPDFVPSTVLDYGSGCGAAFWAIHDRYGDKVKEYTLIDTSDSLTQFSIDIMRGESHSKYPNGLVHPNVSIRRALLPSLQLTYDLVIVHRTLIEIASQDVRLSTLAQLWKRTNRFLVIVEGGAKDCFDAVLTARDFILTEGYKISYKETLALLDEHNMLNDQNRAILLSKDLSQYEKYEILSERLPHGVQLPTASSPSTVFAPCPHDIGCPLQDSSCNTPVRYEPIRADNKKINVQTDGTQQSRISYVILEKGKRTPINTPPARILKCRQLRSHATCDTCTAFQGIQRFTLAKSHGEFFKSIRRRHDGDTLPFDLKKVAEEEAF